MGRQQQLEDKMQRNREAQEESLRRREELIQELELERETRRVEKDQEQGYRTARMQEIHAQVRIPPNSFYTYSILIFTYYYVKELSLRSVK